MAWTTPSTVTAGQTLAASFWNEQVRDNMMAGHPIVTSSTRPSSPFEGQMIYETDTQKSLIYSGSAWVEIVDLDSVTNQYKYYQESLAEQSHYGSSTTLTVLTTSEFACPGSGVLTARVEAELKSDSVSGTARLFTSIDNAGVTTSIFGQNVVQITGANSVFYPGSNEMFNANTTYKLVSGVFSAPNDVFSSSAGNVRFILRLGGLGATATSYVKNIKFSLIYNRHF
jgi:hypothetical protein